MFKQGSYCDFQFLQNHLQDKFGVLFDYIELFKVITKTYGTKEVGDFSASPFILIPETSIITGYDCGDDCGWEEINEENGKYHGTDWFSKNEIEGCRLGCPAASHIEKLKRG